jgi:hypothetical protein
MTTHTILFGVCTGIAATATMDLLAGVFRKLGLAVGAKGQWVGRWYLGLARGHYVHSNIALSPPLSGEKRAAWLGHYAIGIALSVLYFAGAGLLGLSPSTLTPALGYGLATCVFPWFLVLPALGFGVLGLKGPPELKLFRTSFLSHLSYGLGLWWAAKVLSLV